VNCEAITCGYSRRLTLSGATDAPIRVRSAGSKYFDEADRALRDGETAIRCFRRKGWTAVLAAASRSGFLEGIDNASRISTFSGWGFEPKRVHQGETLTAAGPQLLLLRLQYIHAGFLIRHSEFVQAERTLRSSLSAENRTSQKSSLYVAFLQSLAFVREQQGDLDGAEAFYRMTIGYLRPIFRMWRGSTLSSASCLFRL